MTSADDDDHDEWCFYGLTKLKIIQQDPEPCKLIKTVFSLEKEKRKFNLKKSILHNEKEFRLNPFPLVISHIICLCISLIMLISTFGLQAVFHTSAYRSVNQ